ncbi:unnamed protein product [Blepharisma stoltei]|uniref:EF-hand domain-containing protein n=1 Tax=Blepharisma stoltei TaxID=1481888 RepID=A0AAU9JVU9_9CILI|nr:unnamed protein product [Blepharisma stoltei]
MSKRISHKGPEPLTPRTSYSNKLEIEEELLLDLTMNFDPFTISSLKIEFESRNGELKLEEFVVIIRNYLKHWKPTLQNRDKVIVKLLLQLSRDIDMNGNGRLDWDEFTNYIIEKATTLNAMKKTRVDSIKNYSLSSVKPAYNSEGIIEKLINLEALDRIGVIEDYSNIVKFYHPETGQVMGRDLQVKNEESQYIGGEKDGIPYRGPKKAIVHNAIFLPEPEYQFLLTSCNDGTIRTWCSNGSNFHSLNYKGGYPILYAKSPQRSMAWNSSHGILYSGDNTGAINIWNFEEKKRNEPIKVLKEGHEDMVTDLIAVPKLEFLFSCSQDRRVILWDMISATPRRIYGSHTKGVLNLAFNSEYRLLFSAGFDHDIYVWNPYIDTVAFKIEGHNSSLVGVKVLPDSPQVISADIDGWVKVWDIRNLSCVQTFNLEEKQSGTRFSLSDFTFLKKQERIVFGGKGLAFYDYDKNLNPNFVDDGMPLASFYTPNYYKFITPITNKVKVWNAFTGKPENMYAASAESEISCVEIDGWEKRVFIGDIKGHTSVYNIKNGALMKQLTDHKGEVNCIASSEKAQYIATGSLDMTIVIHEDKSLSDSVVLQTIDNLGCVIPVIKFAYYLEILIIGTSEGVIHIWDTEDATYAGQPMVHQGELTVIQVIDRMPLIIACDSLGEVILWALHPLPYKYFKIFSYTNRDLDGITSVVQGISYLLPKHILFTGDDRGNFQALSFKGIIDILDIEPLSTDGRENKMMSLVNKSILAAPDIPNDTLVVLFSIKLHTECIRHVFLIRENETIITTSYDKTAKIISAEDGRVVGCLQQGMGTIKNKVLSKKELEHHVPWHFYLDVNKFIKRDEEEFKEIYEKLQKKEKVVGQVTFEDPRVYEEARNFITPQNAVKLSSDFDYDHGNHQFSITSPRVAALATKKKEDITKQYTVKNAKNGLMTFDLLLHKVSKVEKQKELAKMQRQGTLARRKKQKNSSVDWTEAPTISSKGRIPSLPSLSRMYRENDVPFKKKINHAALKSAADLAKALGEPFF